MREQGVGSVVVVDARSRPVGIFTEHDLVAGAAERPARTPVVGRDDPRPVRASRPRARLRGGAGDDRHAHPARAGDEDDERSIGVVSERDLFSLQRLGPRRDHHGNPPCARTSSCSCDLAAEIRKLAALLVEQGVAAEQLTLFVSVLNDRLCQRIIEIVRKRHQWERISWCWLAFGSEGPVRADVQHRPGQRHAVRVATTAARRRGARAPAAFAREVNEALDACGFPLCKGNVMASNPELCLSLDEWQAKMGGWLGNSDPKALLDAVDLLRFPAALRATQRSRRPCANGCLPRTRASPRSCA